MRIAYGVHGYGRGHAMRALAVLPELVQRHEMLILAGGDAYHALAGEYSVLPLPVLRYHHNRRGKIAKFATAIRNAPAVSDLFIGGPALDMTIQVLRQFKPDVVMSDSEGFTHRAARAMKLPRLSFDHFGLLVYCRPEMSATDRLACAGNAWVYRTLFGDPDRAAIVSFFDAPTKREGVRVVGPVIRRQVRDIEPTQGDHLLVYLTMGHDQYSSRMEQALRAQGCPVWVYGTNRTGRQGNIEYRPLDNRQFVLDLAGCRAVMATTGNQLMSEICHLGKPVLGLPMDCLEQRLNANQIGRLGIGMVTDRVRISAETVRSFLARADEFAAVARKLPKHGEQEAVETIERFAEELTARQR